MILNLFYTISGILGNKSKPLQILLFKNMFSCHDITLFIIYFKIDEICPLKKTKSRRYSAEIIADAEEANDLTLLENTDAQAKFLLRRELR